VKIKEVLQQLNLGNSVAEEDTDLENYFVETETFRALIRDEGDIIAGDKGTGKTALYKILSRRYRTIRELENVEIVTAFNTSGNPIFQRLTEGAAYTEGQYITIWKAYILALAGNWLLQIFEDNFTPSMVKLDALLRKVELRLTDDQPKTVFSRLVNVVRRIVPKAAGVEFSFDEAGLPVVFPKVEFGALEPSSEEDKIVRHTDSLELLNEALSEADLSAWLVLDRLDEAFQGYPETEIPALRALFRTYLDMKEFDHIKLKMFVRRDLFRKVTQGGFVNLTHINARKIEVVWDDDDLLNLLVRRIRTNEDFVNTLGLEGKSASEVFYILFPDQVDAGTGRSKTWPWILARIRDGNDVKPPRNLIDIVKKAREEQQRREDRDSRDFEEGSVLITSEAIKPALTRLSEERVEDTLLAESGDYQKYIDKFRDGKAEHNDGSLMRTLELPSGETKVVTRVLIDMGFLEQTGETYKVPMLYRDGLNITQGKAFQIGGESSDSNGALTGIMTDPSH
jgi:hypothetical protein